MNNLATIKDYLSGDSVKNRIQELLKDKTQQFIITVSSIVNQNEALSKCDPASLVQAALTATAMDLPVNPNLGFVHIIPYNDKKSGKVLAQLQFGYKSFIQLGLRSGQFKTISVTPVYEGQLKSNDPLRGIEFDWDNKHSDNVVGYAAYFELLNGFEKTLYMTVEELEKHGKQYSQTFKKGYGLWVDNFDAMGSKTVIKLLLSKFAPLSIEMQKAVIADQGIIKDMEGETVDYVDNKPESLDDVASRKEEERMRKHIEEAKTVEELEQIFESYIQELPEGHEVAKLYGEKQRELVGKKAK